MFEINPIRECVIAFWATQRVNVNTFFFVLRSSKIYSKIVARFHRYHRLGFLLGSSFFFVDNQYFSLKGLFK